MPNAKVETVLTVKQMEQLLEMPDLNYAGGIRDRAILETLYSTRLYAWELSLITVTDIDFAEQHLAVRDKSGEVWRQAEISMRALEWIQIYERDARHVYASKPGVDALFVSKRGTPPNAKVINHAVQRYIEEMGLPHTGGSALIADSVTVATMEAGLVKQPVKKPKHSAIVPVNKTRTTD